MGVMLTGVTAPQAFVQPTVLNPNGGQKTVLSAQQDETNAEGLTPEEEKQVQELKKTDTEVRAHEQAHKNAAGPYGGAISYDTTTGPDGREYATGGHVQIDVSPVPGNPEATIRKMEIVERAALAPAQPSPEDHAVARTAQQAKLQARAELQEKKKEEQAENGQGNPLFQNVIEAYLKAQRSGGEAFKTRDVV